MTLTVKHRDLVGILCHDAQYGHVDLDAIQTVEDIRVAKRFSSRFRVAVHGLADASVMRAIMAVTANGKRTFRKGCGMWLTDKEAAR